MTVQSTVYGSESLARFSDEPVLGEWLQLVAYIPSTWLGEDGYRSALIASWLELAHRSDPEYGELGTGQLDRTELEFCLPGQAGIAAHNIPLARRYLRGYGWITLCPRELAEQLGGAEAVQTSGAFCDVIPLEHGGLWLQATPRYDEYDIVAARRVFEALSPVLVAGTPNVRPRGHEARHIVAEHPRPGETPPAPTPNPYRRPIDGPTYELVAKGEVATVTGGTQHRWELPRDGVMRSAFSRTSAGGDRRIQILAELAVSEDDFTVGEWRLDGGVDGRPRYRAVLIE